ncbi:MAG TPA: hypothetical protein DDW52_17700 [Planctomycetaceae bacterium]|nr:hypothetical protein [Planctomycetaceae bacterium]
MTWAKNHDFGNDHLPCFVTHGSVREFVFNALTVNSQANSGLRNQQWASKSIAPSYRANPASDR